MTNLNPYISFRDNAREALDFYHELLGGDLVVSSFADGGMQVEPAEANLVMHGQVTGPTGLVLMAADTPSHMEYSPGTNIQVSLSGTDEDELRGYWDKLTSDGGTVTVPFERAPWGDMFGMAVDRFGIHWLINSSAA